MKDFTKKGTKLPVIPAGIKFRTVCYPEFDNRKIKTSHNQRVSMVSYGVYDEDYILCESPDYENHGGTNYFIIKLSTIERLAKEQGMWDDKIKKGTIIISPITTIGITKKKEYIITEVCDNGAFRFLDNDGDKRYSELTKSGTIDGMDWIIPNTKKNQMNPTIKLQENGTVTVTDTETTTTLSKVTVDEICRLVKEDGEKAKLEVGKWYHYIGGLYVWNNGNKTYGFNSQKRFYEHYSFSNPDGAVEASPEIIEQYLTDEAVRRGFNGKVKFKPIGSHNEVIRDGNENAFGFDESLNQLLYCNYVVFRDGAWSEIIKPETITRAEAEKQLGKVITD
mgnify:FL=1